MLNDCLMHLTARPVSSRGGETKMDVEVKRHSGTRSRSRYMVSRGEAGRQGKETTDSEMGDVTYLPGDHHNGTIGLSLNARTFCIIRLV